MILIREVRLDGASVIEDLGREALRDPESVADLAETSLDDFVRGYELELTLRHALSLSIGAGLTCCRGVWGAGHGGRVCGLSRWVGPHLLSWGVECVAWGAGDGNRTRVLSLGSSRSAIELHPREEQG